jgi:RNA polymerase sigma factor (TIGR02999 family)
MDQGGAPDLTELLRLAMDGDERAAEAIMAASYRELHALARARLRSVERITLLDTTSLVHEWYVRFSGVSGLKLESRAHFMRYASRVMRSVIVDHVRKRRAGRRGGGEARESLAEAAGQPPADAGSEEILRVHDALEDLARLDARMAQVVELRYFGGLTEPEIGLALGLTERTVRRDWEKARLWLAEAMSEA